jgi:hypothetical protein
MELREGSSSALGSNDTEEVWGGMSITIGSEVLKEGRRTSSAVGRDGAGGRGELSSGKKTVLGKGGVVL